MSDQTDQELNEIYTILIQSFRTSHPKTYREIVQSEYTKMLSALEESVLPNYIPLDPDKFVLGLGIRTRAAVLRLSPAVLVGPPPIFITDPTSQHSLMKPITSLSYVPSVTIDGTLPMTSTIPYPDLKTESRGYQISLKVKS